MSSGRRASITRLWHRIQSLTARKRTDEPSSDNVETPLKSDSTGKAGETNSATKGSGNDHMIEATKGGPPQAASETNQSSSHGNIL